MVNHQGTPSRDSEVWFWEVESVGLMEAEDEIPPNKSPYVYVSAPNA